MAQILITASVQWLPVRTKVAAVDSSGTYDPVSVPATDRLVSRMMDGSDALLPVVDISTINAASLRSHFSASNGTATINLFAAREGEKEVKRVASIVLEAGTQRNADGRYFAKTSTITSYWAPERIGSSDNESLTGISLVWFDKLGYKRFWVYVSALNTGNLTVETSGY